MSKLHSMIISAVVSSAVALFSVPSFAQSGTSGGVSPPSVPHPKRVKKNKKKKTMSSTDGGAAMDKSGGSTPAPAAPK